MVSCVKKITEAKLGKAPGSITQSQVNKKKQQHGESSLWKYMHIGLCFSYADDVADKDILKKLLNRESENKLREIVGELIEISPNIESLVSSAERQISNRSFRNSGVGCINRMNHGNEGTEDVANKRPFCNGFFGCSNSNIKYDQ